MNFDSLCAERLKSERSRLSLTQGDAAELCGVSREMWSKYERGIGVPGGDVFAAFAHAGADIQYILTGNELQLKSDAATAPDIDIVMLEKIAQKLDMLARQAGRRWTPGELVLQSSKIYNFLIKESVVDDDKIDNVLRLVVNH